MSKPWEQNWGGDKAREANPAPKPWEQNWGSDKPAYGNRADGTPKGSGYYGELNRPDGGVSTELSIGVNMDGQETEIPLLVPGMSRSDIDSLLGGGEPTKAMIDMAVNHAKQRMEAGKSPFAQDGEQGQIPTPTLREDLSQSADFWGGAHNSIMDVINSLASNANEGVFNGLGFFTDLNPMASGDRPFMGSEWWKENVGRPTNAIEYDPQTPQGEFTDKHIGPGAKLAGEALPMFAATVPAAPAIAAKGTQAGAGFLKKLLASVFDDVAKAPASTLATELGATASGGVAGGHAPKGWELPAEIAGSITIPGIARIGKNIATHQADNIASLLGFGATGRERRARKKAGEVLNLAANSEPNPANMDMDAAVKAKADAEAKGVNLTTGEASGNRGLQTLEEGMRQHDPSVAAADVDRVAENRANVAKNVDETAPKGDMGVLLGDLQKQLDAAKAAVDASTQNVTPKVSDVERGETMRGVLNKREAAAGREAKSNYEKTVNPDATIEKDQLDMWLDENILKQRDRFDNSESLPESVVSIRNNGSDVPSAEEVALKEAKADAEYRRSMEMEAAEYGLENDPYRRLLERIVEAGGISPKSLESAGYPVETRREMNRARPGFVNNGGADIGIDQFAAEEGLDADEFIEWMKTYRTKAQVRADAAKMPEVEVPEPKLGQDDASQTFGIPEKEPDIIDTKNMKSMLDNVVSELKNIAPSGQATQNDEKKRAALLKTRDALREIMAGGNKEALKEANAHYREYKSVFSDGEMGKVLKSEKFGGNKLPAEKVMKIIDSPSGREQLLKSKEFADIDNDVLVEQVRDELRSRFTNGLKGDGTVTEAKVVAFRNKHKDLLEQFPELEDVTKDFARHKEVADTYQGDVKAFGKIVGADPSQAVSKIASGGNGEIDLNHLRLIRQRVSKNDGALKALKRGVWDHISKKMTSGKGREFDAQAAKNVFSDRRKELIAAGFTEPELKQCEGFVDELLKMEKGLAGGKSLPQAQPDQKKWVERLKYGAKFFMMNSGVGSAVFDSAYIAAVGKNPLGTTNKMAAKLIKQAMHDPELAKTLMMEVTPNTRRVVDRRLRLAIIGLNSLNDSEENRGNLQGRTERDNQRSN